MGAAAHWGVRMPSWRCRVNERADQDHGESVLTRRGWPSPRAAAGIFGHAQVVEHQTDVTRQALDGGGDGVAGFRLDGADGKAA